MKGRQKYIQPAAVNKPAISLVGLSREFKGALALAKAMGKANGDARKAAVALIKATYGIDCATIFGG